MKSECVDKIGNPMTPDLCTDTMIDMGLTPGHHSGTDGEYAEEEPPLLEFNEAASDYSDCGLEGGKVRTWQHPQPETLYLVRI